MGRRLAILLGLGLVLAAVPAAHAYTGQVTRAYANPDWTRGSLAGGITWTDCTDPCAWLPYATVQPSLPDYRCLGNEALDSDPNTRDVWNGGGRTANGTATFDLSDTPILTGVYGQRLCIMAIETQHIRDPICVAHAPILGYDPNTCPFIDRYVGRVAATALLTQPPPVLPTPAPVLPPPNQTPPEPPVVLTSAEAKEAATKALARKFGRRWNRGRAKQVKCSRKTSVRRTCAVSWRYGQDRYKGVVVVKETDEGVATRTSVKRVHRHHPKRGVEFTS